jgi:hypothetical protein
VGLVLAIAAAASVGWVLWLVVRHAAQADGADRARLRAEDEAHGRLAEVLGRSGFVPDDPLIVESAAVVEPRARAEPCPLCGGPLHVRAHEVDDAGPVRLRRLTMRCGDCGRLATLWAEIAAPTVH